MTQFEEFANEIGVKVTTDERGFYTKWTEALAVLTNEVILSDDDAIRLAPWEKQKEMIKRAFFKAFPYMAN